MPDALLCEDVAIYLCCNRQGRYLLSHSVHLFVYSLPHPCELLCRESCPVRHYEHRHTIVPHLVGRLYVREIGDLEPVPAVESYAPALQFARRQFDLDNDRASARHSRKGIDYLAPYAATSTAGQHGEMLAKDKLAEVPPSDKSAKFALPHDHFNSQSTALGKCPHTLDRTPLLGWECLRIEPFHTAPQSACGRRYSLQRNHTAKVQNPNLRAKPTCHAGTRNKKNDTRPQGQVPNCIRFTIFV